MSPPPDPGSGGLETLDEAVLATLLRDLPRRPLHAGGELRLSLAGAQDKMALVRRGETFFLPRGDVPTTHILKPAHFAETVSNEYFCMRLAALLGLRAPAVELGAAEDVPFLLIERYDRTWHGEDAVRRVHQEDFCQALGVPPERKYQTEGGPSLSRSVTLLDACTSPVLDRLELLRRVVFNTLVGHAGLSEAMAERFPLEARALADELAPSSSEAALSMFERIVRDVAARAERARHAFRTS